MPTNAQLKTDARRFGVSFAQMQELTNRLGYADAITLLELGQSSRKSYKGQVGYKSQQPRRFEDLLPMMKDDEPKEDDELTPAQAFEAATGHPVDKPRKPQKSRKSHPLTAGQKFARSIGMRTDA